MSNVSTDSINNMDELRKRAEIDDRLAQNLKRKDCKRYLKKLCYPTLKFTTFSIFNSVRNVMGEAEKSLRSDDKPNAYIYYLRAGTLCGMIQKRPEKNNFVRTEVSTYDSLAFSGQNNRKL